MVEEQNLWVWNRLTNWYPGGWLTLVWLHCREGGAPDVGYVIGEGFFYLLVLWPIVCALRAFMIGLRSKGEDV